MLGHSEICGTALVIIILVHVNVSSLNTREADSSNTNRTVHSQRRSKFLNLFSVIRFSNTPCTSKNGLNGTCYTDKQCQGKLQWLMKEIKNIKKSYLFLRFLKVDAYLFIKLYLDLHNAIDKIESRTYSDM